jgi:membrane protein implicated in regulation of membrane protease activity
MTQKYRALKLMAVVYKILAWVTLAAGLVVSIFAVMAGSLVSQQLGSAAPVAGGLAIFTVFFGSTLIGFGTFYALAQGINLMFELENRTRPQQKPAAVKRAA